MDRNKMSCKFKNLRHNIFQRMKIYNSKGFSLVEVLTAVGILAVVALGVSLSFNHANNSNRQIVLANTCQDVAASTLNYITNFGVSDHILPILVVNDDALANNNFTGLFPSELPIFAPGGNAANITLPQPIFTTAPVAGVPIIANSQYIINGANAAQTLYNSDGRYCNGGVIINGQDVGLDVTNRLFANNNGTVTRNVSNIYLKIRPFDLTTNAPVTAAGGCPPNLVSAPRRILPKPLAGFGKPSNNAGVGAGQENFQIGGDSDLGYLATFTIQTSPGGRNAVGPNATAQANALAKTCSVDVRLQHQRDLAPPIAPNISLISTGTGKPLHPANGSLSSCDGDGAGYDTLSLTIDTANTVYEPGSVILCQTQTDNGADTYAGPNNVFEPPGLNNFTPLVPCGSNTYFLVGGVKYFAFDATPAPPNPPQPGYRPKIILTFGGAASLPGTPLPKDRRYNLRTVAIDTAGNESITYGYLTGDKFGVIIDGTRPNFNAPIPATVASGSTNAVIGRPEDGIMGRSANSINPYANSWGAAFNYLQCDFVPGNPGPVYPPAWQASAPIAAGSFPDNWVKCTSCALDADPTKCLIDARSTTSICVAKGNSNSVSQGTHTMTLTAQDVCGLSATPVSGTWSESQTFYGVQNPAPIAVSLVNPHSVLTRGAGPPWSNETISILAPPEGTILDAWYSQCDCDTPYALNNLSCTPSFSQVACVTAPQNFNAQLNDICNRQVTLVGDYEIQGKAGDNCGTETCGPAFMCPLATGGGVTQGICTTYAGPTTCGANTSADWQLVKAGNYGACPPSGLYTCTAQSGCGAVGAASYSGSVCDGTGAQACVPQVSVTHCQNDITNICDVSLFPVCTAPNSTACTAPGPGVATNCVYSGTCVKGPSVSGVPINPACLLRGVANMCGAGPQPTPTTTTTTVTTTTSTVTTVTGCSFPSPGLSTCTYSTMPKGSCNTNCYGPTLMARDTCSTQFYACNNLPVTGYTWVLSDCGSTLDPDPTCSTTTTTTTTTDSTTSTTLCSGTCLAGEAYDVTSCKCVPVTCVGSPPHGTSCTYSKTALSCDSTCHGANFLTKDNNISTISVCVGATWTDYQCCNPTTPDPSCCVQPNGGCVDPNPVWNSSTCVCDPCPVSTPIWNPLTKLCEDNTYPTPGPTNPTCLNGQMAITNAANICSGGGVPSCPFSFNCSCSGSSGTYLCIGDVISPSTPQPVCCSNSKPAPIVNDSGPQGCTSKTIKCYNCDGTGVCGTPAVSACANYLGSCSAAQAASSQLTCASNSTCEYQCQSYGTSSANRFTIIDQGGCSVVNTTCAQYCAANVSSSPLCTSKCQAVDPSNALNKYQNGLVTTSDCGPPNTTCWCQTVINGSACP
jgi:prepilin-type N-terminal cleavage/methylation domain-containing protein